MRTIVFVLCLVCLLCGLWLVTAPPSPVAPLAVAPRAVAVGINADLAAATDAGLAEVLDRLQQGGLSVIRQRFAWDQLEPNPGDFQWAAMDRVMDAAAARGIEVLAVLDGSPAWARRAADAGNPLAPPQERADFGQFAAAVAQRYGDQLRLYQVWDEPNIAPHWGAQDIDPADYAGLLREAAVQIKAADPSAVVLTAALAPTLETNNVNLSDVVFLDRLLAQGAAGWFDAVAAQPYGFDQPAEEAPADDRLNYRRIELLRAALLRHGLANVPLYAVSAGWYALPAGDSADAAPWPAVDETTQAASTADAMALAQQWPWLAGWLWAGGLPGQMEDPRRGFALWTDRGEPRPVAAVLQQAAAPPTSLGPGHHLPNAPALQYGAGWRATAQAADPGRSPAESLRFRFRGQRLDLAIQRGPYWAYFEVLVDGQPANRLPRDEAGNTYLVLHDPLAARATVTIADELAPGEHTAVIRPVGGWGQWNLLGIDVYDETGVAWPAGQLAGYALLGLGALGLILAAVWPRHRVAL